MSNAQILQQAISAIKSGDKATGQKLLLSFVKTNPNHETALLWLSVTTDDITKKRQCFERVLTINPNNEAAKRGLVEFQKQVSQSQQIEVSEVETPSQQVGSLPKTDTIPSIQPSQVVNLQPIDKPEVKEQRETTSELPLKKSVSPKPLKAIKQEATKKCPYCAETIKAEANVCRFCGRDLKTGEPTGQPPKVIIQQTSQKQKKRNPIVTFLAALGLVSLLCVCLGIIFLPSSPRSTPNQQKPSSGTTTREYLLELLIVNDERAHDYITVQGQVKNISGDRLEAVEAVVEYYDAQGNFVTSDSALIDFNPILSGQTSPFSVITKDNPAIKRYSTSFKFLLGGTIPTKDGRK